MSTKSASPSTTVLVVLLVIFTFPIWIGIAGGLFGLVAGLMGACFGIIAGIFGAIFGALGAIFGAVFGIFDWSSHGLLDWVSFPHFFGFQFFVLIALTFVIVLLINSKKKK